jgi:hypothetical protein
VVAAISLISASLLPETRGRDLDTLAPPVESKPVAAVV